MSIEPAEERELKFVVHEHFARRHHFDFRLEMDGVLKSWAVPKAPPEAAGEKRLAVEVPDHPLAYGDFEGLIPEGEYGAGRVEIWDRGPYRLIERRPEKIVFELRGEKLRGVYILLFFKADRQRNWLFFRPAEGAEKPGR